MKNNKFTRAKASKQEFVKQLDGTEVLHTKEAKAKQRRWTFVADVKLVIAAHVDSEGNNIPAKVLPVRTLRMDNILYGTASDARIQSMKNEEYLRSQNKMFADSVISIRAVPHETVSLETVRQLTGSHDLAMILDKALQMSIEEAQDVVAGKTVGAQFMCAPATDTTKEKTISSIKEDFYRRALDTLKPIQEEANVSDDSEEQLKGDSSVLSQPEPVEVGDTAREFVPEIINIERATEVASI